MIRRIGFLLSRHAVHAANHDAFAITESIRHLQEAAEGLSDGDLAQFEPFRRVLHVEVSAGRVVHDGARWNEQHSPLKSAR